MIVILKAFQNNNYQCNKLVALMSVTFCDFQPDNTHLVAGMSNRFLSIKYRLKHEAKEEAPRSRNLKSGTYRYFVRGKHFKPLEVSACHDISLR